MDTSSFIRVYLVGPTVTMMTSKEDKYRGDTVIRVAQHEKGPTSWQHHKLLTDKEYRTTNILHRVWVALSCQAVTAIVVILSRCQKRIYHLLYAPAQDSVAGTKEVRTMI